MRSVEFRNLVFTLLCALPVRVMTHDAATLDAIPSAHGGQVRMLGPYHVELLLDHGAGTGKRPVRIYFQNHAFQGVPAAGIAATLKLTDNGITIAVELKQDGAESMLGFASYFNHLDLVAVLLLVDKDGQSYRTIFMPFEPKPIPRTAP
jgi:hypothetical protein